MAMRRRVTGRQAPLFVSPEALAKGPGHPFYEKLNGLLAAHGFDAFVEARCAEFYASKLGRPSIPPGVYFRMLMIGYFEGLDSERGIDWRVSDSLSLRDFLGFELTETTPDHSSLSRIRQRLPLELHQEVFTWVLQVLQSEGLLKGQTVSVDASTLEANAALRTLVRREGGQGYREYLVGLAQASGIATPTREDLARIDKQRPHKLSNADWEHPVDADARVTKMKDGRTHMGYKVEHAVDLETNAVLAVTIHGGDAADTATLTATLEQAQSNLAQLDVDPVVAAGYVAEVVADKGYHSNETMKTLAAAEIRSYVSEPHRGRRRWTSDREAQAPVYANRRRIRGRRGRALQRRRAEYTERSFAHSLETGGLRRVHLRGRQKIAKRMGIHLAALNLGLLMRHRFGIGTPRGLQDLRGALSAWLWALWGHLFDASVALADLAVRAGSLATVPICLLLGRRHRRHYLRGRPHQAISTGC